MAESEKKQVNSEAGQELFGQFVKELSELYGTKKIIMFGAVEPEGEGQPQLILAAHGDEKMDLKEFSFSLFKMIGKITNLHALGALKNAAEKLPKKNDEVK